VRFAFAVSLNLNELRELLTAINQMDIAEVTLKSTDFELTVRRGLRVDEQLLTGGVARIPVTEGIASVSPPVTLPAVSPDPKAAPDGAAVVASATTPPPTNERRWTEILSPMVGTFYRAPAPDEPPFVEVGDRIRVGQTVCIIEAMKLMNEIEAESSGEILEILVQNGEPVEYNQPLMRVSPG
jgi:acetyl-CoA carboxylase biotin carboxyl carrier protein